VAGVGSVGKQSRKGWKMIEDLRNMNGAQWLALAAGLIVACLIGLFLPNIVEAIDAGLGCDLYHSYDGFQLVCFW